MQLKQPKVQLPGQQATNQPKDASMVPPPTPPAGRLFSPMNGPMPQQMATPNKMPNYAGQGGPQGGDMHSLIQMIQKIMGNGGF